MPRTAAPIVTQTGAAPGSGGRETHGGDAADRGDLFPDDFSSPPDVALVVFSNVVSLPWLRILKPGYRHCFAALRFKRGWVMYDPTSIGTGLHWLGPYPIRLLMEAFLLMKLAVIPVRPQALTPHSLPWRPYTCVEAVKRILGQREPWVFTPWQLFQSLRRSRTAEREVRRQRPSRVVT